MCMWFAVMYATCKIMFYFLLSRLLPSDPRFIMSLITEPVHEISNNLTWQMLTQTSLCSLLLSLETPNDVESVAQQ